MRRTARKAILIVIDGLTPRAFEAAVESGAAPALAALAREGEYRRSVSTFPSLTPVCLSTIATGSHPDVHGIPHLVWWNRRERRLVEYGSSFHALRAAGLTRGLRDTIFNLNQKHLSPDAVTIYEALEDAGLTAAAVNITCYRGRTRHLPIIPGVPHAFGPRRFFWYSLFESDPTGAPIAVRNRATGSIDAYAACVGRWLVTRDGFDFLVYYLPDYDYASHAFGPDGCGPALARSDAAVQALIDAAGGLDEFLERYAVVLCADHGQTLVERADRLEDPLTGIEDVVVAASNRAGMVYDLRGGRARALAERLDGGGHLALFREDGALVARRDGEEGLGLLDEYPQGRARAAAALANPNAGELIVSAAPGAEFVDLGGRHHLGGGSHGSLTAGDSLVPMLTVGLGEPPDSIAGIAPLVLRHFSVEPPSYGRAPAAAA
ncbi:MAG TPA: alkaline phosphatase family protein [Gaiellaceae bacterium]|nr:alkaline phosphatase family protein [Gaiellaceae bacterium]